MTTHDININDVGTPDRKDMGLIRRGDIVSFTVGNQPMILCLDFEIFEAEKFEIRTGSTAVRIKPDAPFRPFKYYACRRDDSTVNFTCTDVKREVINKNTDYNGDSGSGSVGM